MRRNGDQQVGFINRRKRIAVAIGGKAFMQRAVFGFELREKGSVEVTQAQRFKQVVELEAVYAQ